MSGTERDADQIVLDGLCFDAIVGILPSEQVAAQPVRLDIVMDVPLEGCARSGDLSRSIDYAEVAHAARFIAQQGRWRLIESLAFAICRGILAPPVDIEGRAAVRAVEVAIRKPTILGGLATPGVRVRRSSLAIEVRHEEGVRIEVLEETPLSGAWRVHLAEGAAYTPPPNAASRVVAGAVLRGSDLHAPGDELARGSGLIRAGEDSLLLVVGAPTTG